MNIRQSPTAQDLLALECARKRQAIALIALEAAPSVLSTNESFSLLTGYSADDLNAGGGLLRLRNPSGVCDQRSWIEAMTQPRATVFGTRCHKKSGLPFNALVFSDRLDLEGCPPTGLFVILAYSGRLPESASTSEAPRAALPNACLTEASYAKSVRAMHMGCKALRTQLTTKMKHATLKSKIYAVVSPQPEPRAFR